MRISDWSSDVCSSDLVARLVDAAQARGLPAPDQAGVSSQAARQQLRDHRGLAVRAGREHHRFVLPPHGRPTQAGSLGIELRSEEHTSELQSLMRISYAVFCLKTKKSTQSN